MIVRDSQALCLPDVNVWIALLNASHSHHSVVADWFLRPRTSGPAVLCRLTQMGLLRLLTQPSVMGASVMTQRNAWKALDQLTANETAVFRPEFEGVDAAFRRLSDREEVSPQRWADDYIIAFAEAGDLVLVTLDHALAKRASQSVLLSA